MEMDTHIHTLFLCFIPLGIWRKVSGPSLLYTQASLHLSTLFPSQVFMLSLCFLVSLVPSLLFSSTLFDLLSPPTHFSLPFTPCLSLLLPQTALSSLSSPFFRCLPFSFPSPPPLLFPPVLLRVSLSYPFASNSPSLSCSLLASLCNNKLRTNSMYISLFSPAR